MSIDLDVFNDKDERAVKLTGVAAARDTVAMFVDRIGQWPNPDSIVYRDFDTAYIYDYRLDLWSSVSGGFRNPPPHGGRQQDIAASAGKEETR